MPVNFTEAYKEALALAPTNVSYYETMTFSHSAFPSDFRIVRAEKVMTLDGDEYLPAQFACTLPEVTAGSNGTLEVSLADVSQEITRLMDVVAKSSEKIAVDYKVFTSSEATAQAYLSAALEVKTISQSGRILTASVGYPDAVNKKIPAQSYRTNLFRGLR